MAASPDKLCASRRVTPLPNGQIPLARNITTGNNCSIEVREILDTATFRGPQGPQGPQGLPGRIIVQLSAYDSTDTKIGPVLGMNCQNFNPAYNRTFDIVLIGFAASNHHYLLCIARDEVLPISQVYYTTNDCSGTPYADSTAARFPYTNNSMFTPAIVLNRAGQKILMRADYSIAIQQIVASSNSEPDGTCAAITTYQQVIARRLIEELSLTTILNTPF